MTTIKAILKKTSVPHELSLEDVPFPTLKPDHVLIKIKKTAICGTDINIYNWGEWAQRTIKTPQIIGHEFVGEVIETGEHVKNVKIGQLVSGEGHIVCGCCRHCVTEQRHLCRMTVGIGVNMDGVFAQYIAFPASNIWVCDPGIAEEVHSVMDPFGNSVHTALSFRVVGEDVLVTGAGPTGLMAVPILKRGGARTIVVTDVVEERLALAKKLGATAVINVADKSLADSEGRIDLIAASKNDLQKAGFSLKEGFDVGLEMSGSSRAFADMVDAMANGGSIAILGILPKNTLVDLDKVIFSSLTLRGIYGRKMYDTWYRATALLQSGMDKEIAQVITDTFHYTEYKKAFEHMTAGKCGKVILTWD